ncbi:MAG: hypothetical protein ACOC3V_04735, partial [bacterium]
KPQEYKEKFDKDPSFPMTIKEIEEYWEGEADFTEYYEDIFEDEIYKRSMEYKYVGRLWTDSKLISFWKYPEDFNTLKKVIESLENKLNIKIWNNDWKILVIEVKGVYDKDKIKQLKYDRISGISIEDAKDDSDFFDHTEKIIPLESYDYSINPSEEEWKKHVESPLKKKLKKVPFGLGSKKKIPSSEPGEIPSKTRYRLYKESLSKKVINNLPFDTLAFKFDSDKGDTNETINKIIEVLYKINVNNPGYIYTHIRNIDTNVLVLPLNIKHSSLENNTLYHTSLRHYETTLENDYKLNTSELLSFNETIKLINNKILNSVISMYEPRILVREGNVIKFKEFKNFN